ncbi:MAG: sporulation protein YabP [Clostridia bacterium]|nr:sporulation protein YabP [Clostridia bacterium]
MQQREVFYVVVTDEKKRIKMPHSVTIEDRGKMTVTGVSDVDSFDEQTMIVYTDMGELTVRGKGLHISRLNTETGELNITGTVSAIAYTDDRTKSTGFLNRLFR